MIPTIVLLRRFWSGGFYDRDPKRCLSYSFILSLYPPLCWLPHKSKIERARRPWQRCSYSTPAVVCICVCVSWVSRCGSFFYFSFSENLLKKCYIVLWQFESRVGNYMNKKCESDRHIKTFQEIIVVKSESLFIGRWVREKLLNLIFPFYGLYSQLWPKPINVWEMISSEEITSVKWIMKVATRTLVEVQSRH